MYEYFEEDVIEELNKMGFNLYQRQATYDFSNGITSSIMFEDNNLIGVSDYRSDDYLSIGVSKNNEWISAKNYRSKHYYRTNIAAYYCSDNY